MAKENTVNPNIMIFCWFGCHIKGDRRFYFLKENNPKIYEHLEPV
jgi:hypothetical protein